MRGRRSSKTLETRRDAGRRPPLKILRHLARSPRQRQVRITMYLLLMLQPLKCGTRYPERPDDAMVLSRTFSLHQMLFPFILLVQVRKENKNKSLYFLISFRYITRRFIKSISHPRLDSARLNYTGV